MKKRFSRRVCSKAIAAATGAAILMSAYAPSLASAADTPEYISEVYLSYGDTPDKARQWLTDNGYTVLDQDLNEGAEGGVSWLGLASDKRSVYLGYKTTTDEDKAIRDMRAMNMNGDYSYDEYEKLLENKKSELNAFASNMKIALSEYRENYKKGTVKAKLAHDKMNLLIDNDSDNTPLGDLLLEPIKEEMSAEEYEKEENKHADMTTILMQGNINSVDTLMTDLCLAAGTDDEGWLTKLSGSSGLDGLYERYGKEFPSLSESKITALLQSDFDEDARLLADKFADLREDLKAYTECPVNLSSSSEEVDKYFNEHPEESISQWTQAAAQYSVLENVSFDGLNLKDIVLGEDTDLSDEDNRMILYPILDSMSPGQRSLLSYVSLGELLITGSLNEDGWAETAENSRAFLDSSSAESVYLGIDRSVFSPAGIALTSDARKFQNSTGSSYSSELFGINTDYIQIGGYITGGVLMAAGICSFIHGYNMAAKINKAVVSDLKNKLQGAETRLTDFVYDAKLIKRRIQSYMTNNGYEHKLYMYNLNDISPYQLINQLETFEKDGSEIPLLKKDPGITDDLTEEDIFDYISYDEFIDELEKESPNIRSIIDGCKELKEKAWEDDLNRVRLETAEKMLSRGKAWKIAGAVISIAGLLISIGTAVVTVYDYYKYYHQEYTPIPDKIVHESKDDKGRAAYTVYYVTPCNRSAQGFGKDNLGDNGDMNGDVGKQWLALYTTKDKAAGDPITADIIAQKGSNKFPAGKGTTVRLFGQTDSINIVSTDYGYNDSLNGLYIFSGTAKTDEKTSEQPAETPDTDSSSAETASETDTSETDTSSAATETSEAGSSDTDKTATAGSVVGTGVMVGSCVGSAAIGALICFLIVRLKRKDAAA